MEVEKLFNADVLMEKHKNKVVGEHVTNIVMDEDYFVKHSIYFAESLSVFEDEAKTLRLVEGRDYKFSKIDSISSEMANRDCYRAIVFLTDIKEAWIDYHSYGDVISAEKFNELINELNSSAEISDELKNELNKLIKSLNTHINDKAPHGSSIMPEVSTLALRSDKGSVKTKAPEEDDDAVNLGSQRETIQESEKKIQKKINEARTEAFEHTEAVNKKVKAENPAIIRSDFFTDGITEDDLLQLPQDEQQTIIQNATNELKARVNETEPFYNVVRNENGGVTVPDAVDENEAVNKKTLMAKMEECDDKFIQKAQFTLNGTTLEINF